MEFLQTFGTLIIIVLVVGVAVLVVRKKKGFDDEGELAENIAEMKDLLKKGQDSVAKGYKDIGSKLDR